MQQCDDQEVPKGVAVQRLRLGLEQEVCWKWGVKKLVIELFVLLPIFIVIRVVFLILEERPVTIDIAGSCPQEGIVEEEAHLRIGRKNLLCYLYKKSTIKIKR
jgi:hypothetical protein